MNTTQIILLYRNISLPLLTSTVISANSSMDETRKTSSPPKRAKTAAAEHNGMNAELSYKLTRNGTAMNMTSDDDNCNLRTITSYYSIKSGTKSTGMFIMCVCGVLCVVMCVCVGVCVCSV